MPGTSFGTALRLSLVLLAQAAIAQTNPSLETVIQQVRGGYRSDYAMRVMRDVYASDRFFTFPLSRDSQVWAPQPWRRSRWSPRPGDAEQ